MEPRVALVTLSPFPIGNVATVRYSSYCKAIARKGIFTKVYVIAPSRTAAVNKDVSGVEDGVAYQYMCNKTGWDRAPSSFIKLLYYTKGLFNTAVQLRRDNVTCVILFSSDLYSYFFMWGFKNLFPVILLTDKSEYPFGYKKMGSVRQFLHRLKLKVFDGLIVMTSELMKFYETAKADKAKLFHLPMTIDLSKFDGVVKFPQHEPYIACVFGVHNRDGLLDTVKAYKAYRDNLQEESYKLWLIGDFSRLPDNKIICSFIFDNGLESDVLRKGVIAYENIPQILADAECLITTATEYVSGGFPTKLGEYLASGTPVVATSAGEIDIYLTNRKNAFLSKPGDIVDISSNLIFVHKNKGDALVVAQAGRAIACKAFNAESYADDLILFVKSVMEDR